MAPPLGGSKSGSSAKMDGLWRKPYVNRLQNGSGLGQIGSDRPSEGATIRSRPSLGVRSWKLEVIILRHDVFNCRNEFLKIWFFLENFPRKLWVDFGLGLRHLTHATEPGRIRIWAIPKSRFFRKSKKNSGKNQNFKNPFRQFKATYLRVITSNF